MSNSVGPRTVWIMDYVFYCLYAFARRTPIRKNATVWSPLYLSLSIFVHATMVWYLIMQVGGWAMPNLHRSREIVAVLFILVMIATYRWYDRGRRYEKVIKSFEKDGHDRQRPIVGAVVFAETLLLPTLITGGVYLLQH